MMLLMMLLTATTAWADDPTWLKDGDSWDATTKTLTVNSNPADRAYMNNAEIEHLIVKSDASVTTIGNNAFYCCTNLKTVNVGSSVTTIGGSAFYCCTSLKAVNVGSSVTTISNSAFAGCTSLKAVNVGSSVTTIGAHAFDGCTNLKSVFITNTNSVVQLSFDVFINTHADLKIYVPSRYISTYYSYNNWKTYYDAGKIVGYEWTSGSCVVGLNDGVLSVAGIGAMADYKNPSGRDWDNSCSNITSVVIEDGVTHIGEFAFFRFNNASFTAVTIPASVESIGIGAFAACSNLTKVNVLRTASVPTVSEYAFYSNKSDRKIHVFSDYVDSYKAAWTDYASDIEAIHFLQDGDTYTIYDATGWGDFCDLIEGGESFSGKIVKLGANITVTRIAGSGAGGNLTTNDHPFCGTFDGGGNTLTFNYGSSDGPADENNLAPFRYVNNATIEHLHVSGNIYTQHVHAAGIIGMAYGMTNIADCRSSVNIHSSINGDGTHGGIMSCSWTGSTTNITGCLFDGSIQSVGNNTTDQCGGFVGWKNATINVTNSLLTADLSTIVDTDGLTYPSATFVRNPGTGNNAATITNCYYTRALGTEQGTKAFAVKKGYTEAVTPDYATSGIKLHDGYMECDGIWYAPAGTSLKVGYVDEHGDTQSQTATVLGGNTGSDTNELSGGWYVAGGDISYSATVQFNNNIQLILADGGKMNVAVSKNDGLSSYNNTLTIYGQTAGTGELHANSPYASSLRAKSLIVNGGIITANERFAITINGGNMTVNQGNVTANGQITLNNQSSLTMNGGSLSTPNGKYITGDGSVIFNGGVFNVGYVWVLNVTLNYTSPDDRFKTQINNPNNTTVTVADGKAFTDGTNIYSGTLTDDEIVAIRNKTLRPCLLLANDADNSDVIAQGATLCNGEKQIAVALQDRTLTKNGEWNTLCLPFAVVDGDATDELTFTGTPLKGATVKKLDVSADGTELSDAGVLTLKFNEVSNIEAGKPYIVKWASGEDITNPVFSDVTITSTSPTEVISNDTKVKFVGQYSPFSITDQNKDEIVYIASGNKIGYVSSTATLPRTLKNFRARFWVKPNESGQSGARAINVDWGDGETTQITTTNYTNDTNYDGSVYDLQGRKVSNPTKGIYIVNGKKVVIK